MIAGTIALGTILAPAGWVVADTGPSTDGTSGPTVEFEWDGESLEAATAIVAGGAEGLDMRATPSRDGEVVATIPNGTVVALRIAEVDTVDEGGHRWWPVSYGGESGWVSGRYLIDATGLPAGTVPFEFDGESLSDAAARVRAVDGLRLRAEPSWGAEVIGHIPNGTVVDLWIDETDTVNDPDGVTRWWPVEYDGSRGWVSGYYLTSVSGDTAPTPEATSPAGPRRQFSWSGGELEGATAVVVGDGESVNMRAEPSKSGAIVSRVADGTRVNLRISHVDSVLDDDGVTRWWPVEVGGTEGWISGFFLSDGSTDGSSRPDGSDIFPAGTTALVQTQSGGGAKLRSSAGVDGTQIGSVAERSQVTILRGPVSHDNSHNGWFEVRTADGQTGFIDGDLLVLIATPAATSVPPTTEATATETAEPTTPTATATEPAGDETSTATSSTETPQSQRTPTATATTTPDDEPTAEPTQATQPPRSSSQFVLPVSGAVQTQGFGCSSLGFYPYNPDWGCGVHDGIDFAAPAYTPIVAVADGTVVTAGWCDCGLGYYVEIDHGNNVHTIYGHMATQPYVSVGQRVTQGETIGPVGSTGLSTGPHVHFMVQVNGVSQDPARYLP